MGPLATSRTFSNLDKPPRASIVDASLQTYVRMWGPNKHNPFSPNFITYWTIRQRKPVDGSQIICLLLRTPSGDHGFLSAAKRQAKDFMALSCQYRPWDYPREKSGSEALTNPPNLTAFHSPRVACWWIRSTKWEISTNRWQSFVTCQSDTSLPLGGCYGLNCMPPNLYIEVLTHSTSECHLIWK